MKNPNGPEHDCQASCEGCPFKGPKVGSKGDPTSPIVFVAESPGIKELDKGEPLVGPSGKIFHNEVPMSEGIYVLNAMECFPGKRKDEDHMTQATHACHDRLIKQIKAHPRRIIITMGNAAMRSLVGDDSLKITQERGKLIDSDLSELGIFPVIHPAALGRGTGSYRIWRDDLSYAMFMARGSSPIDYVRTDYGVVPKTASKSEVRKIVQRMLAESNEQRLFADIETSSLNWRYGYILNLGISSGIKQSNGRLLTYIFHSEHFDALRPYFENTGIRWCWHNGKFDVKWFHEIGIKARCDDDTMLLSYAFDENTGVHGLEQLANDLLKAPDYKYMVQPYLKNKSSSYADVPDDVLDDYCSIDVGNTAMLYPLLRDRVYRDKDLQKLYEQTLIPAQEMLTQVEHNGFLLDQNRLDENEEYFIKQRDEAAAKIQEICGYPINPGSPQQVKDLLFTKMKLPDKANGSTNVDVLKKLVEITNGHPILLALMEHRKAVKMYGTYVKGLRRWMHADDGRVHPTFKVHGTITGRLAVAEPNSQNPPRLPQIRGTFVAPEGYELIECDLSQAELRTLACLSKDPLLMEVYNEGLDLHTDLANFLFPGWDEREASGKFKEQCKEERVKCKNVNFGIVYGITEFGLFEQMGGSIGACKEYLNGWFTRYKVAGSFINKCRATPMRNQIITTTFGRKKRVGIVASGNHRFLQNEAANFPAQSIASDITLHAAIQVWRPLLEMGVRIVNLVHDAIIMEVPITPQNKLRKEVIQFVCGALEGVPQEWGLNAVPYVADAEVGHRWGSLVSIDKLGEEVLTN